MNIEIDDIFTKDGKKIHPGDWVKERYKDEMFYTGVPRPEKTEREGQIVWDKRHCALMLRSVADGSVYGDIHQHTFIDMECREYELIDGIQERLF